MCIIKNKQPSDKFVKLKDETISFIKKYMLSELNITEPIDENTLQLIEDKCFELDSEIATKEISPDYIISDEEKCKLAGDAEADIFNALESGRIDYDYLNKQLGL